MQITRTAMVVRQFSVADAVLFLQRNLEQGCWATQPLTDQLLFAGEIERQSGQMHQYGQASEYSASVGAHVAGDPGQQMKKPVECGLPHSDSTRS
jgi:hypothetical protein